MKLTIYGKDNCQYCDKLTEYLLSIGIDFTYINVLHNQRELLWLKEQGHTTVPQVYLAGSYIGNCDQTIKRYS